MSFSGSAENIRVDDGHILRAQLRNGNGDLVDAEVDLNNYLGNSDGRFQWGEGGYSGSAQDITFSVEGEANVPVLRAHLINTQGNAIPSDVNLNERIGNDNGNFVFV